MKRNVQSGSQGSSYPSKVTRRVTKRVPRTLALTAPSYNRYIGVKPGFPQIMKMKHKYVEVVGMTDTGAGATYFFSCNGMYDPNITGSGHQPYYFDQMGAIYDHYCVIQSKIKCTIVPAGTTVMYPYRVSCFLNDDTSLTAGADSAAEQTTGSVGVCAGGVNPTPIVLRKAWNASTTFHPNPLADSELRGTPSANPTEQTYYCLYLRALATGVTVEVYVQMEIEFTAMWTELKDLAAS